MSNHMPAPWEFWHNEKGGWSIKGQSGEVICQRNDWDHRAADSIANGKIMAAAPELLAALKDAAQSIEFYAKRYNDRWDGTVTTESVLGIARAAIAKAEGRGT